MADPIDIVRRETHTIHPGLGRSERVVAVFYRLGALPERVIYIPEDEWTEDEEKERVKQAVYGPGGI